MADHNVVEVHFFTSSIGMSFTSNVHSTGHVGLNHCMIAAMPHGKIGSHRHQFSGCWSAMHSQLNVMHVQLTARAYLTIKLSIGHLALFGLGFFGFVVV